MKLRKLNKKAGMESESIIIWIVVIAVVILAMVFISKMDLGTIIKNLPGVKGPGEEDKMIDIDESLFFNCKYPVGIIPVQAGTRDIKLLNLQDIQETPFDKIEEQLKKADPATLLKMEVSGNDYKLSYIERDYPLFSWFDSKTTTGSANPEYDETGKMIPWRKIEFREELRSFIFNENENTLPGLKEPLYSTHLDQLRKDLRILYNARYHPSTGIICGDEEIIKQLKEAEKCVESCEIYGGVCKVDGEEEEIKINGKLCKNGDCFVKASEKLEDGELKILSVELTKDSNDRRFNKRENLLNKNSLPISSFKMGDYNLDIQATNKDELICISYGNSLEAIYTETINLNSQPKLIFGRDNIPLEIKSKELILFAIYEPSKQNFVYKTMKIESQEKTEDIKKEINEMKVGDKKFIDAKNIDYWFEISSKRDREIYGIEKLNPTGYTIEKIKYIWPWTWSKPQIKISAHFISDYLGRSGISSHELKCDISLEDQNLGNTLQDILNNCKW